MRTASAIHSELLTAAARLILRPMGLVQQGRSRTWFDDNAWWLCVVEFQPSSWSRGSYLNVGCMWLWHVKEFISFDEGSRIGDAGFIEFCNESQFAPAAQGMAEQAAKEVARYRKLFPNVAAVSNYYLQRKPNTFWPNYHAAVACGLMRRVKEANRFFDCCLKDNDERDWMAAACDDVRKLKSAIIDAAEFPMLIAERVMRTRELQKLAPIPKIGFESVMRQ